MRAVALETKRRVLREKIRRREEIVRELYSLQSAAPLPLPLLAPLIIAKAIAIAAPAGTDIGALIVAGMPPRKSVRRDRPASAQQGRHHPADSTDALDLTYIDDRADPDFEVLADGSARSTASKHRKSVPRRTNELVVAPTASDATATAAVLDLPGATGDEILMR
jgi:hypothetical protein